MYSVDGNGVIDPTEATKIHDILGFGATIEERAKNIFNRMDKNKDGRLTEKSY